MTSLGGAWESARLLCGQLGRERTALLGDKATTCQCACAADFGVEIPLLGVCGNRREAVQTLRETCQRPWRRRLLLACPFSVPCGGLGGEGPARLGAATPRLPGAGRAVPGGGRRPGGWGNWGVGPLTLPPFFLLSGTCTRGPMIQQPLCDLEDGSHTPGIRKTQRTWDPDVAQSPSRSAFSPTSVFLDPRENPAHDLCGAP